jgi:DinB superfamily
MPKGLEDLMDPRYPIGKFTWSGPNSREQREQLIEEIAATPERLRKAVEGLTEQQLNTPYREGGWTVRQVVHHVPDSHMNSYIRFKFALSEHEPTIKPYDEAKWAEFIDAKDAPIELSLQLLDALHHRWVMLLRSLTDEDVNRKFMHPELGRLSIDQYIALYAWHGKHHVAHITSWRERK